MREVCEFIWEEEARLGLVDDQPIGFPLWPALRSTLGHRLTERLGRGQAPHLSVPPSQGLVARIADQANNWIARNPFFFEGECRYMIVEHPRTVGRGAARVDLHSRDLEDEWDRTGTSWLGLSDPSPGGGDKQREARRRSTSFIYECARVEARLRRWQLPYAYAAKMRSLDQRARSTFGVEWGAERFARQRFRALCGRKASYVRLLQKLLPERVFILVAYGSHVAVTAAAQQIGIPVTEVQHGAFSRYHLGYSYAKRSSPVPGFPDEFLAWSEPWADTFARIHPVARVRVREPAWLIERRRGYQDRPKEKVALVLSQGLLGDAMAREFTRVSARFAGYRILYKLHPGEYGRAGGYPHLQQLVRGNVVEVLGDCDLELEMARAEVVVGVYSTSIYEALELGCRAYLLDLPGVETMQDLLDSGKAEMV